MINTQLKKGLIFFAMGVWTFYLFDMISGSYSYMIGDLIVPYGTINFLSFSQLVSWWPVAINGIMTEHLCLQDASLFCNEHGIYPLITIWIHSILIEFIGIEGTWYFGSVILPVVAFLLLTAIYSRYISFLWAFALSSLSILPFSGYPFRQFIMDLAMGSGWSEIGARIPPDVTGFPNPSLPLVFFLGLFLFSTGNRHLSFFRIMILTVAWSLLTQVHLLYATIGIVFWFSFLALSLYRHSRGVTNEIMKTYVFAIFLCLLICTPSVLGYIKFFSEPDAISFAGQSISFSEWGGILLYVLIPISFLAILYRIDRIDPFEIIVKFLPIWVIMVTEIALFLIYYMFEIGFSPLLIQSRIGMFFLHMLYFVPLIYYLSRKERGFSTGTEALGKSRILRNKLHWLFNDASYVYIPVFLLLLSLYTVTSSSKISENQKNSEGEYTILLEQISILKGESPSINILVSDNPSVNLAISSIEHFDSLWVNRFARNMTSDEAIDRLSLYAHIVGWDAARFMLFMMPPEKTFSLPNNLMDFSTKADIPGLGYWLVFHGLKHKTDEDINRLKKVVSFKYNNINLFSDIKRFKITRVFLEIINNQDLLKMATVTKYDNGYLLEFMER